MPTPFCFLIWSRFQKNLCFCIINCASLACWVCYQLHVFALLLLHNGNRSKRSIENSIAISTPTDSKNYFSKI
jgi:hypothetical protein